MPWVTTFAALQVIIASTVLAHFTPCASSTRNAGLVRRLFVTAGQEEATVATRFDRANENNPSILRKALANRFAEVM